MVKKNVFFIKVEFEKRKAELFDAYLYSGYRQATIQNDKHE